MTFIRHIVVLLLALLFIISIREVTADSYALGVGKADITGPPGGVGMMGYFTFPLQKTMGILDRLYARAYIIEDASSNRVVFVNCDLLGVFQLVHQKVLHKLGEKYGDLYTKHNVLLHAQHTHAGPGGYSAYSFYNIGSLGFSQQNFDIIVTGIVLAISQAHDNMHSDGTVRVSRGELKNCGVQRSPVAYDRNPKEERNHYELNKDTTMTLVQLRGSDGELLGAFSLFPVHGTSLRKENQLISGDNKGYAEFLLEVAYPNAIISFGQSNSGDIIPEKEGKDAIESVEIIGGRQADFAQMLLQSNEFQELTGSIVSKATFVDFSNVTIEGSDLRTCTAMLGQVFLAGKAKDSGFPDILKEDLEESPLLAALGLNLKSFMKELKECHSPKIPFIPTGLMKPVPWTPDVLPLQILKLGDQLAIGSMPFEVTTMAGRRIKNALKASIGIEYVELASISNAYASYMTTPEEYSAQYYEGTATLFGPNQLTAVIQEFRRLATSVVDDTIPLDEGPSPRTFDPSKQLGFQPRIAFDQKPFFKSFGDVQSEPDREYSVGQTVSAVFHGGHPNNKLSEVRSFCDVEKKVENQWVTFLRDDHWDVRYIWKRHLIAQSHCTCQWKIGFGTEPGQYRIRHYGFVKNLFYLDRRIRPYTGVSRVITVRQKRSYLRAA